MLFYQQPGSYVLGIVACIVLGVGAWSCTSPAGTPPSPVCLGAVERAACGGSFGPACRCIHHCPSGQICACGFCKACVASPEICDGRDNDCDGRIDNLKGTTESLSEACYNVDSSTRNVGPCKEGSRVCQAGQWGTCVGEVLPVQEICDGKDNDCDGSVDEDFKDLNSTCTVGSGMCQATGKRVCDSNLMQTICQATPGKPQTEICDGKDNNCNGLVDEFLKGCVSTRAGNGDGNWVDGKGTQAILKEPWGLAFHPSSGNLYIAGASGGRIRKIDPCGHVTTLRDLQPVVVEKTEKESQGQRSIFATFEIPRSIAVSNDEVLYIGSKIKNVVYVWHPQNGRSELPVLPEKQGVFALALDPSDKFLYLLNTDYKLYRVALSSAASGKVTEITTAEPLGTPNGLSVSQDGHVFLSDIEGKRIVKVSPDGTKVTTVAGGNSCDPNVRTCPEDCRIQPCRGSKVTLTGIIDVVVDAKDNLYAIGNTGRIWQAIWVKDGVCGKDTIKDEYCVTQLAGKDGSGFKDGPLEQARFSDLKSVAVTPKGNLWVSDPKNYRVRMIQLTSDATPLKKECVHAVVGGTKAGEWFSFPSQIAAFPESLMVTDTQNNQILSVRFSYDKSCTGYCVSVFASDTTTGSSDKKAFNKPTGIVSSAQKDLFVVDQGSHTVRKVFYAKNSSCSGERVFRDYCVEAFAGSGKSGLQDGPALEAQFKSPYGVARSQNGVLYVADEGNGLIREVAWSKEGCGTPKKPGLCVRTLAKVPAPRGIAWDEARQTLYFASTTSHQIYRMRLSNSKVEVIAKDATFLRPSGMFVDGDQLYIADSGNKRVQSLDLTTMTVRTVAPDYPLSTEPTGVLKTTEGDLYIVLPHQLLKIPSDQ